MSKTTAPTRTEMALTAHLLGVKALMQPYVERDEISSAKNESIIGILAILGPEFNTEEIHGQTLAQFLYDLLSSEANWEGNTMRASQQMLAMANDTEDSTSQPSIINFAFDKALFPEDISEKSVLRCSRVAMLVITELALGIEISPNVLSSTEFKMGLPLLHSYLEQ